MVTAAPINVSRKRKSQGRGRSNSLPCHVVEYLKNWLMSPEHINHPYPSESEKARMVADTGIEIKRLNNWFVNNRIRFWKPRFEAMQKQQEMKTKMTTKSKENSILTETNIISPQKGTPRSPSKSPVCVKQEVKKTFEVVLPTLRFSSPGLDLRQLGHTVTNASATVSDDDSCSSPHPRTFETRCRKRQRIEKEDYDLVSSSAFQSSPRFKCTRNDVEQWKLACSGSFSTYPDLDDTNLPSLDDAVQLFGYAVVR